MSTPVLTSPPILSQAWRLEAPVREPATKAGETPDLILEKHQGDVWGLPATIMVTTKVSR
jgi:hypothetical protein